MQHNPTAAALSTSFLLNRATPPHKQSQAECTDYKILGVMQQHVSSDWSNTGNALLHHLSFKKLDFRVSPFCQVVQKHKLFDMA